MSQLQKYIQGTTLLVKLSVIGLYHSSLKKRSTMVRYHKWANFGIKSKELKWSSLEYKVTLPYLRINNSQFFPLCFFFFAAWYNLLFLALFLQQWITKRNELNATSKWKPRTINSDYRFTCTYSELILHSLVNRMYLFISCLQCRSLLQTWL